MKETIEINGKSFSIQELNAIIEASKNSKPTDKVYTFHATTEKEFNKKHKDSSNFIKAIDRIAMIVAYYNKGEKVDFNNKNQKKFYPHFYMDSNKFRFSFSFFQIESSSAPASLCFLREDDLKDAMDNFLPEYKDAYLNF